MALASIEWSSATPGPQWSWPSTTIGLTRCWCGSGEWVAPKEHRRRFAGQRALYKLYLIYQPSRGKTPDLDPVQKFAPVLIPALNKAFAPAMSGGPKMVEKDAE